MAAKLILSMDGVFVKEYPLDKERMTIGRKAHNDIIIDNLAVSGEHAAIVTILNDSFLEDLDSTNGLEVNGAAVKKHFMQPNDVIGIGKYSLKYVTDQAAQNNPDDFEKTVVLRAPLKQPPVETTSPVEPVNRTNIQFNTNKTIAGPEVIEKAAKPDAPRPVQHEKIPASANTTPAPQAAAIQILTGSNAGKELNLVKNLTTLGKPGVQVAVLTRRPHGFFITHVEGATFPSVNGQLLSDKPHQMNDHDVIELAGVKMEFYFKG